jgi:hypothetical protein
MYGNYTEGFDLIDNDGNDVRFDYTTSQKSVSLSTDTIDGTLSAATYTISGTDTPADTLVSFEFPLSVELKAGATLTFSFIFNHSGWSSGSTTPVPTETNGNGNPLEFSFPLIRDYVSVYDLWLSDEWQEAIGISLPGGNIQPMATAEDGTTLTDLYNTIFADILNGAYEKYQSGISAIEQAIITTASAGSGVITFQFPAIQYQDNITAANVYTEYLSVVDPTIEYLSTGTQKSLHSNRGYEIGIVYMDEFNRSTPALVSENNTEHFPCSTCDTANSIDVTIPTTQLAPFWAKKYKFAIKPDRETYETIYSNIYFTEPGSSDTYFLLEGENAAKITDGQRLIVKRDVRGSADSCLYATVLEKEAKQEDFIDVPSSENPSINLPIPSGVYMKIDNTNLSVNNTDNSIINLRGADTKSNESGISPRIVVPMNIFNPTSGVAEDFDIPRGSRVVLHYRNIREGGGLLGRCEKREYQLDVVYTASADYDNMYDWFVGDNIDLTLNNGAINVGPQSNEFLDPTPGTPVPLTGTTVPRLGNSVSVNKWQFFRFTSSNSLVLAITGAQACGSSDKRQSFLEAHVTVYRADETVVFESEPLDASPDIWYESSESFGIVEGTDKCRIELGVALAEPTAYCI